MQEAVTVNEAMTRDFVGVSEGDSIVEAAALLAEEGAEGAIVLRGSDPVGMLTAADVLVWVSDDGPDSEATVGERMRETVPTVDPTQSLEAAAAQMFSHSTTQLAVTENGSELQGVLTQADIVAATTRAPSESDDSPEMEPARVESDHEMTAQGDGGFSDQGICQSCGSLMDDLAAYNGQLLCADCRDV